MPFPSSKLPQDNRKITWIDWESVCLNREVGGLGVRRIREFNLSLLGKWCWRMLVNREGLWFRVLTARYGLIGGGGGGGLQCGDRNGSVWWREIASIRDGGASVLGWSGGVEVETENVGLGGGHGRRVYEFITNGYVAGRC
uniref:Uncharacterized protein n=1 Tax=Medicago truncatula TaxID=3880 RepID=A2Q6F0_MEDTR|nr:hypothetical protein MtrDRAFT_AC183371g10v1 [Medicago truncatula]